MKLAKLIKKSKEVLVKKEIKKKEKRKLLLEIQSKLKKKSKDLKEKYKDENDKQKKKLIAKDLAVVAAQRKKIIHALKELS